MSKRLQYIIERICLQSPAWPIPLQLTILVGINSKPCSPWQCCCWGLHLFAASAMPVSAPLPKGLMKGCSLSFVDAVSPLLADRFSCHMAIKR